MRTTTTSQELICSACELAPNSTPGVAVPLSGKESTAQDFKKSSRGRKRSQEDTTRQRLEPCLLYMTQHLDQPLRISTLCSMTCLSQSHFFALFKRITGHSPISYFIRERMRCATELLAQTALSVKAVSGSLGYNDPYYFSRLFKSVYQVAPSVYRASLVQTGAAKSTPALPHRLDGVGIFSAPQLAPSKLSQPALNAKTALRGPHPLAQNGPATLPRIFSETKANSL
jgi:AraC-like DNA-binding protein